MGIPCTRPSITSTLRRSTPSITAEKLAAFGGELPDAAPAR
jgi:hypothetical protein